MADTKINERPQLNSPVVSISIEMLTRETSESAMDMAKDYLAEEFARKLRILIDEDSNVVNVRQSGNKITMSVKLLTSYFKRTTKEPSVELENNVKK